MGEGERFDEWIARLAPESGPQKGAASRRTGLRRAIAAPSAQAIERQGEGYFGNLRKLRELLWVITVEQNR
jgi:hypothetical protein